MGFQGRFQPGFPGVSMGGPSQFQALAAEGVSPGPGTPKVLKERKAGLGGLVNVHHLHALVNLLIE